MSDEVITCSDCRTDFVFSASEAAFYATKGLTKPKRCKPCRQKRKAAAAPARENTAPAQTQWVSGAEDRKRDRRRDRRHGKSDDYDF